MFLKKIIKGILIGILVITCCTAGFSVNAKTQAVNPQNKSYAWLEDLFIRESSSQNTINKMIPVTNYPYSRTCPEFKADVKNLLAQHPADGSSIEESYYSVLTQANSVMIAMGATDTYEVEKKWLEDRYGILYPSGSNDYTELYTNVLYGALKYNMFKTLYGKTLVIPHGVTLEKAIVIYIDTVTDPDDSLSITYIDTVKEYGIAVMRERLIADGHFDVDGNTSDEDLYRYNTILLIRKAGYTIDNDATDEQIRTYFYLTSIWKTYGIKVQPAEMVAAMSSPASEREEDVQWLILKTMIEEKGENTAAFTTVESAFKKTLELGYFKLPNGFYSDIYNYRVELNYVRSSVWITPHSFAYRMPSGSSQNASIRINGSYVVDKMPMRISLDSRKAQQLVEVTVKYTKGSLVQSRNYRITFVQGKSQAPATTTSNDNNSFTTNNSSYTLPYITSYEGSTYYIGNLSTLPDGASVVTNKDGTIIGIDDSSLTAADPNNSEEQANSADISTIPLKERLRKKLPLISIISALIITACIILWIMFKKKGSGK